MITELLGKFEPDGDVLLRSISAHVTDEMLECIAQADYGCDFDAHLAALRQLRDTGDLPATESWVPLEVLQLTRWSDPENPEWKPGSTGEFGHWIRAFSCAAILRAEHEPWNYKYNDESTSSTTIQLLLSLDSLPVDLNREAARNFAWLILKSDPEGENDSIREYGVTLLWFALHLKPAVPDADLISLAEWVVRRADELKWDPRVAEFSGLKGMVIGCQKRSAWEMFGLKLSELDLSGRSTELKTWVRLIAEQLVE
ncbi:hypothetical protein [Occallatibacter savannae]|uniref:hypothetical protein n=1 Tax=Occallatibacter savannae TaxID=1002691 RepID=UPI000D692C2B|nr:hypothetical protein [Occallatibacter savannae]